MNNDIVLSVCLITYNHARFLPKALEGILMQHVNFPIEFVVGDDCSSDNSIEIIWQYALKSPFQFRILDYQTHYGMHKNRERTIRACQGKYVALLEGDDYWIDSNKLQTQVDILEQDLTLSVCCTNASVESDESIKRDDSYPYVTDIKNGRFTVQTIIRSNFIPTCTVVFRNGLLPKIMPGFFYTGKMVDVPIHTYNLLKGDGWFTD